MLKLNMEVDVNEQWIKFYPYDYYSQEISMDTLNIYLHSNGSIQYINAVSNNASSPLVIIACNCERILASLCLV